MYASLKIFKSLSNISIASSKHQLYTKLWLTVTCSCPVGAEHHMLCMFSIAVQNFCNLVDSYYTDENNDRSAECYYDNNY